MTYGKNSRRPLHPPNKSGVWVKVMCALHRQQQYGRWLEQRETEGKRSVKVNFKGPGRKGATLKLQPWGAGEESPWWVRASRMLWEVELCVFSENFVKETSAQGEGMTGHIQGLGKVCCHCFKGR